MGFDRNTIIGFLLIGLLMAGMFYFNNRSRTQYEQQQKHIADSIAALQPKVDPAVARLDSLRTDSLRSAAQQGGFVNSGAATETVLENDVLKLTVSSKGGQVKEALLKKFNKEDGSPVILIKKADRNSFGYSFNAGNNTVAQSSEINFTPSAVQQNTDGSQSLVMTAGDAAGHKIEHVYTLRPGNYMVDFDVNLQGAEQMFTGNQMRIDWKVETPQVERNHKFELTQTDIGYVEDGDYDFHRLSAGSTDSLEFKKPVSWLAMKQQFFINALVSKNKFEKAVTRYTVPEDTSSYLVRSETFATAAVTPAAAVRMPFQLYLGPSDYHILKGYNNGMHELVPLGSGMFSFVKYINRYLLLPLFDFLKSHVASMGIVILLITLVIRLITSPILYRSYLSGAKMKMLKPEVDKLRAKFTNPKTGDFDQQGFSMEQMKLWRSAGVSPMGGCVPALLQIPIFMSLYYFFQSNIGIRGQNFLWSQDLATYDSILKLPFNIPMYGDHVSLFALLATITSFLISVFSAQSMADNTNPALKYMPYIMPLFMLLFFNSLPSALTWYYTVSNTITLILQFVIQKFVINHDKILADINENMKKPVKKSKLQERMESMQEMQKKMQEQQARTKAAK